MKHALYMPIPDSRLAEPLGVVDIAPVLEPYHRAFRTALHAEVSRTIDKTPDRGNYWFSDLSHAFIGG